MAKSRAKPATPEGLVKQAVTDLLTAERIWWMRCQSGAQVLEHNGKRRVFRAGRPGMADLLALPVIPARCAACRYAHTCSCHPIRSHTEQIIRVPQPVWIECKAPKGRQSPAQVAFQSEVEAEGHTYLLVNDVAIVQDWLRRNR